MTVNSTVVYVPELEEMRKSGLPDVKRFTDKKGRKLPMTSSVDAYKQLAEYEETGITPEVVRLLKKLWFGVDERGTEKEE